MPFKSDKQRKFIYYLRGKYSTKKNTPKKYKWIWAEDWVSENKILTKFNTFSKNMEFKKIVSDKKEDFKEFITKFKKHLIDNKKASLVLYRYTKNEDISKEELDFFKSQTIDFLKSLGIGIPTIILPGGVLLLSFIIWLSKYFEVDILPSYLKDNDKT